eukprot:6197808-Pleurochrysis_carterae.AAC.1
MVCIAENPIIHARIHATHTLPHSPFSIPLSTQHEARRTGKRTLVQPSAYLSVARVGDAASPARPQ